MLFVCNKLYFRITHVIPITYICPIQKNEPQVDILGWEIHVAFDELLRKVVGKRKYRPFEMPEVSAS